MSRVPERREFQRLRFGDPLSAQYGGDPVQISEIGVSGARIEHGGLYPVGRSARLSFRAEDRPVEVEAEVVRCVSSGASRFVSGLRFERAAKGSAETLRELLALMVRRRLQILGEAGASAGPPSDDTLRPRDAGFLTYSFEDGVWKKRRAFLPDQPEAGFTVAAGEDRDELQRLCRAWEQTDQEGKRLIRLFAELSIAEAMGVPRPA